MLSMFLLWFGVFAGILRGWKWTPLLALGTLAWTVVLLNLHMTDPIPLNF